MNRNVSEKDQSIKSCGAIPAPVSTNNPLGLTGWGMVGTGGGDSGGGLGLGELGGLGSGIVFTRIFLCY